MAESPRVPTWREIGQKLGLVARAQALTPISETLHRKRAAMVERRVESKAVHLTYPAERFWLDGNPAFDTRIPQIGKRRAYSAVALVFACMDYRSTKLSEAPLWIVDETDDGEAWLKGEHPLSALLERPNPDMTMPELLQQLSLYDDATAGWLLVLNRDRAGRVASMYPYAFDEFSVEPANGRLYGLFRVQTLTGSKTLGPEDVIFFKRPSLASLVDGTSRVNAALAHINIGDQMRQTVQTLLRRSIRPASWTEVPTNYVDDQARRLKADLNALFAGFVNAGANMIVEGGAKLHILPSVLKDLELGPVQQDVEAAICQVFQVHPGVVAARLGVENSSGFADLVDSATKLTYDIATIPTWSRYAMHFTQALLRPIDPNPRRFLRFDTTKVRALQVDMTAKVNEAKLATGFWTVNEQRAHTQKPKIDGGDELSRPAANPADPNAPSGDNPNDPANSNSAKSAFAARSLRVVTGAAIAGLSLSAAWQDFDAKAQSQESRYEAAAVAQFDRERDGVVALIEQAVPASQKDDAETQLRRIAAAALLAPYLDAALVRIASHYAENGVFRQEWVQRFTVLVRQTMADGARDVAATIGVDFNLSNPRVRAAIAQRVTRLTGSVTETTLARVRDVITEARSEGVGISEITQRIRDDAFGGTITTARAKTIARTETVGALNEGEHLAAVESGVMQSKRWLSQRDGKVRPSHRAAEAEGWIPIAQRYSNGLDYPHQPGAPAEEVIYCRCAQLFSDQTADEANRGQT